MPSPANWTDDDIYRLAVHRNAIEEARIYGEVVFDPEAVLSEVVREREAAE